jgi:hypothetical protein
MPARAQYAMRTYPTPNQDHARPPEKRRLIARLCEYSFNPIKRDMVWAGFVKQILFLDTNSEDCLSLDCQNINHGRFNLSLF